ncbi:MAG: hypothetical protein ABR586_07730 [Thermoplasmatota archaeon]
MGQPSALRWGVALAALLLCATSTLAAATEEPASAYGSKEGVSYLFAYGPLGNGALASGPAYDGSGLVRFDGCAFVQLRPAFGSGRILAVGQVDGGSDLLLQVDELRGPTKEVASGIATNLTVDGSLENGSPLYPRVLADAAVWGTAHGYFLDPVQARLENFTDPVGGGSDLAASLVVTRQGFRDSATNGILSEAGGWFDPHANVAAVLNGRPEIHLRIRSPPGAQPQGASASFASTGTIPDNGNGYLAPSDQHNATFSLFNSRFGGQATARMAATALAPAGSNSLRFSWYSPTGELVGSKTLEPALRADAQAELAFPLSQFGTYHVVVSGKVALAKYAIAVDLAAPKTFDLNFWWHDALLGAGATNGLQSCEQALAQRSGAGDTPISTHVGRERPPGFPVGLVALAVAGAAATTMMLVKLITEAASEAALRRQGK